MVEAGVIEPFDMPARPNQRARYLKVIDATISLAAEGGFDGVQMRAVSERSGVALGTVYGYFQSRDNLIFRATVRWSMDVVTRALEPGAMPEEEDLEADVVHLLQRHADEPRLLDAFVRAGLTADPHVTAARQEIAWGWWIARRPNFAVLGPELAPDAPQLLNDVFYAAAVRWAFGEITLDDVVERVRQAVRVLVRASA